MVVPAGTLSARSIAFDNWTSFLPIILLQYLQVSYRNLHIFCKSYKHYFNLFYW